MAGIAPLGALNAALDAQRIAAEYAVRALKAELDVSEQIGAAAVQLIEAAAIDPQVGQSLNLSV